MEYAVDLLILDCFDDRIAISEIALNEFALLELLRRDEGFILQIENYHSIPPLDQRD